MACKLTHWITNFVFPSLIGRVPGIPGDLVVTFKTDFIGNSNFFLKKKPL